ncbi:HNH endonuclease [Engelhardtia mirabilis]|uniref:HNH endonuclease n=1 Tax=Engelhardtia mirabilis TaxID=2528011 RepID=UPI003AF38C88
MLKRDGGRCFECLREARFNGESAALPVDFQIEEAHFCAWSQGGATDPENVFILCLPHHREFDCTDGRERLRFALDDVRGRPGEALPTAEYERIAIASAIHAEPRGNLRSEIWQLKARFPGGPSLLAEEAEIFLAQGKAAEAWRAARGLLRATDQDDDIELAGAFSIAAQAAQMFGDMSLAVGLTEESICYVDRAPLSLRFKTLIRTKRTTELANHLMTSGRASKAFVRMGQLDDLRDELRLIGVDGERTLVHLDAFIHLRDVARWSSYPRGLRPSASSLVSRSESVANRVEGQGALPEVRRTLNVAHTLFQLGSFGESAERLEAGALELMEIGDVWNAALTGFQAAESVLRSSVTSEVERVQRARGLIQTAIHASSRVKNDDVYWRYLLDAGRRLGILRTRSDGGTPPRSRGALLDRPYRPKSAGLRQATRQREQIRLIPRPHRHFMSDLSGLLELPG